MNREKTLYLLNRAEAFVEQMKLIYDMEMRDQTEYNKMSGFSSYKTLAIQLNALAFDVRAEFPDASFMLYDTNKMKGPFDSLYMSRKDIFDGVFIEAGKIKAFLESKIGQDESEIDAVISLISKKLRSIVREAPKKEVEVQDKIDDLLTAKGYIKGSDYDRETGRVKTGIKESVPDFIFEKYGFCIEVKIVKTASGPKEITEQMNADISSYSKKYKFILFVVYDVGGQIQNVEEFKQNMVSKNIFMEIIKH
jgi:hypothetical protein